MRSQSALQTRLREAVEILALDDSIDARGAIYTRSEVVDFVLDLVGYRITEPLTDRRILEPSFGNGDFLFPIIDRLLSTWRNRGSGEAILEQLSDAIRAVEVHRATYEATFASVVERLVAEGILTTTAVQLAGCWLVQGDYLLDDHLGDFDYVVGNPPYIRHEALSPVLVAEYRRRYKTMFDRADIYVAFFEHALKSLKHTGMLAYICSDRWLKNRYGGPLRQLIADQFHLKFYIDMVGTSAFQSDVSAYPAITVIGRGSSAEPTRAAYRPEISKDSLSRLADSLTDTCLSDHATAVQKVSDVFNESEPWLLGSLQSLGAIRRIEAEFPTLEEVGCLVGIGVATGADRVFIGDFEELNVESDRKLRLVMTSDIRSGQLIWQGKGVINPFAESGNLVNLTDYPLLSEYLFEHYHLIKNRHIARKNPHNWYRTIDRITPALAGQPKLLIPDIKGAANVVYENGQLYPHHNLYYVTSAVWNLRALQAVLLSRVTRLFIRAYSTTIRGGFLRFQAQYLRRIRLPKWDRVPQELRTELVAAAVHRNIDAADIATYKLYRLTREEIATLESDVPS